MDNNVQITNEQYQHLLKRHIELLKSTHQFCKWFDDWRAFRTPNYLNQVNNYKRKTEEIVTRELKILQSNQAEITFTNDDGKKS